MRFLYCFVAVLVFLSIWPNASHAQTQATSDALTTICRFNSGPRAGSALDFHPFGVRPFPVGQPCSDFQGSSGIAGLDGALPPITATPATDSDLTTVCRFDQGPKAGTSFDFKPFGVRPFHIGRPCTDFAGSSGVAGNSLASLPSPAANGPDQPAIANAPELTTVCRFDRGPRAGSTFDFKPFGVQPFVAGQPCSDFRGSSGIAELAAANAPDRAAEAKPATTVRAELTTTCRFDSGPKAGATADVRTYGVPPVHVGYACSDYHGSSGTAIR